MKFKVIAAVLLAAVLGVAGCASKTSDWEQKIGVIVYVTDGVGSERKENTGDEKVMTERFIADVMENGRFKITAGFEEFYEKEHKKEIKKMEAGGKDKYYEVTARLAKRFGIRHACVLNIDKSNQGIDITALVYDAKNEAGVQVISVNTFGGGTDREQLVKQLDETVARVIEYLYGK